MKSPSRCACLRALSARSMVFSVCFLAVLMAHGPAIATEIYGVRTDSGSRDLVKFDSANPSVATVIGSTGITNALTGLDFDASGNLYALELVNTGENFLYSVNRSTGATTLIGGSGLAQNELTVDLSWDPLRNRMVMLTGGSEGKNLWTLNLATGAATLLGALPDITDNLVASLAIDKDGTYYVHGMETDAWYKIDPSFTTTTLLGPLGFDSNFSQGATIDWRGSGTLFHAALNNGVAPSLRPLLSIDKVTGAVSDLGLIGTNILPGRGIELGDIAIAPVPEPATLFGFSVGMGLCALSLRRRS